jgi:hypothetical protein
MQQKAKKTACVSIETQAVLHRVLQCALVGKTVIAFGTDNEMIQFPYIQKPACLNHFSGDLLY